MGKSVKLEKKGRKEKQASFSLDLTRFWRISREMSVEVQNRSYGLYGVEMCRYRVQ